MGAALVISSRRWPAPPLRAGMNSFCRGRIAAALRRPRVCFRRRAQAFRSWGGGAGATWRRRNGNDGSTGWRKRAAWAADGNGHKLAALERRHNYRAIVWRWRRMTKPARGVMGTCAGGRWRRGAW